MVRKAAVAGGVGEGSGEGKEEEVVVVLDEERTWSLRGLGRTGEEDEGPLGTGLEGAGPWEALRAARAAARAVAVVRDHWLYRTWVAGLGFVLDDGDVCSVPLLVLLYW